MDNTVMNAWDEDRGMENEDRYYYAAGIRFEKAKKYTVEDYEALPEDVRMELIDGVFYEIYSDLNAVPPKDYVIYPYLTEYDGLLTGMAAPSPTHQKIVFQISRRIGNYIEEKGGDCEVYPAPFEVRLKKDDQSVVEPDISVICDPDKITDKGCEGAPDWIIEVVSPGNPGHDYIRKLNLYLDAGIREYWIIDPVKDQITVYNFEETDSAPTYYTFMDVVNSGIYDDLYIDFKELLKKQSTDL